MSESKTTEPILLEFWLNFLTWLFDHTEKFPKNVRFTMTNRIENLAMDIMEIIIDAAYSRKEQKISLLQKCNLKLETLRFLIRLSYSRRLFATNSYEYSTEQLLAAGKMIGGWIKQQNHE